jgi:hypothetical protein
MFEEAIQSVLVPANTPATDSDFIDALRASVDSYLAAVDAWEAEYRRFYRMPGVPVDAHPDLAAEQQTVALRRRDFRALLPRARRLCLKYQVRDSFSGLLRLNLGQYSPQERADSAIGRSERNAIAESLIELKSASQVWTETAPDDTQPTEPAAPKSSLLQRLVDFFY